MKPVFDQDGISIFHGDALAVLKTLPARSVQCCTTSPPYFGLRDYQTGTWEGGDGECDHSAPDEAGKTDKPTAGQRTHAGRFAGPSCWKCGATRIDQQLGLEPTPAAYVAKMVQVFAEVRRVLADDGVLWVNIGDSYNAYNGNRGASTSFQSATEEACPELPGGHGLTCKDLKPKDLVGIPWRVAFGLQADGWYLRSEIIWHKPNPMPESVTDRPTKAHEQIFLLSKQDRYYYDAEAVAEPLAYSSIERLSQPTLDQQIGSDRVPGKTNGNMKAVGGRDLREAKRGQCLNNTGNIGFDHRWSKERRAELTSRNRRTVWTVTTQPFTGAHFATYPPELIEPCIKAGSRPGDVVLDPFHGSGTTGAVAQKWGRRYIGIELNADYIELSKERFRQRPLFPPTPEVA